MRREDLGGATALKAALARTEATLAASKVFTRPSHQKPAAQPISPRLLKLLQHGKTSTPEIDLEPQALPEFDAADRKREEEKEVRCGC